MKDARARLGRSATKGDSASEEGLAGGPTSRLALVFDVPEPLGLGGPWVGMVALLDLA